MVIQCNKFDHVFSKVLDSNFIRLCLEVKQRKITISFVERAQYYFINTFVLDFIN